LKKNFFISYTQADRGWAEWIAWQLEEAKYTTIIQAWDFGAGNNFVAEMQKAAAEAERTIAVLSPDYLKSRFTLPEWTAAFGSDPTGEQRRLVPVRVRECDLGGLLPQIVYIDLVGIGSETEAAEMLLGGVTPGRRKPLVKPLFPGGDPGSTAAPPFPGSSAPPAKRRRAALPRDPDYLFVNVPPMPTHFVGRDELLAEMVERLTSGTDSALSASGQGGVGKTTMAVAIAHDPEIHGYFSDGVLWAGLGLSPDVMSALTVWGDALGVDVTRYPETSHRVQAIRNKIGLRRFLLVIDDAWQEEAAMLLKCGGPNCCHLLTTRDDGIAQVFAGESGKAKVPVLDEEPAFELLRQFAPRACNANPDAARRLARTVDGLPLALELLGAYLAPPTRSQFPQLTDEAFAELADAGRRLELATKRLGDLQGEEVTLRATIRLSLGVLPPETISAFNSLGAFAPKPETFDLEAALAVTGNDAQTIAVLVEKNLVEADGQSLALHQTVREVAQRDMPADARQRHAAHYLTRAAAAGDAWRDIEKLYGQIKWAFDSVTENELPSFNEALAQYQRLRGLWADSIRWNERGLEAAENRQDKKIAAALLNNIGLVYDKLGQRERALQYYERTLPIRREVGDRSGEGVALNNIGAVYDKLGQREKALQYYERALPIRREVGDRSGEAATLSNIGFVYDSLGRREKALQYYERALLIQQEVGDRYGEAVTLNNIGAVYENLGQREKALQYFERALPLRQEVGDRPGEATTRFNIAMILRRLGELERSAAELRRVVALDQMVQHPDLEEDRAVLAEVEAELGKRQQPGTPWWRFWAK
jgi:tetratricopeptide (TPR) repeat protein